MERAITWIASLVALALLLGLPAGYYALERSSVRSELKLEAEHSARLITEHINAAPELWRFKTERLEGLLVRQSAQGTPLRQRLVDGKGAVVVETAVVLDDPTVAESAPVFDSGREAGRIELTRSLQPALVGSAFVALLAALLGGAVFVALRLLPMRALRRAERLAREQTAHAAWLEKAHQDAVAEARLKAHYLARLTHEIRAPLGGLLGMTETLRNAPLSISQRRQAQRVHDSGEQLLQVVSDILDHAQLAAPDAAPSQQVCDPISLVEGVIELLSPQAEAAGLALFYELGPGLPAQVEGDPGRLRQVLYNLVGNAIKFTPHGDVKVVVKWVPPTTVAQPAVHFEVRDTGVGIHPRVQARLFDLQIAGGAAGADALPSAGMGLPISRQLVHQMGGEMGLHSQPGAGSRFWFEIPQRKAPVAQQRQRPRLATGAAIHVLVADPHKLRARALCSRLMALDIRVNAVHTADDLRVALFKPGLRFTHVMALAAMGVKPTEAPWLRWVTLHEGGQHAFDWNEDESDTVLTMPCRRDELVALLQLPEAAPRATPAAVQREDLPLVQALDEVDDEIGEIDTVPGVLPESSSQASAPIWSDAPEAASTQAQEPVPANADAQTRSQPPKFAQALAEEPSEPAGRDEPAPLPPAAHTEPPDEAPEALPEAAPRREVPTVLLVESNEVSQEVGRALLESMGCEVYLADDGHQALQRLPQGFGLILLDMQIQGMDGYTTASEIRRWEAVQPRQTRTPLVALSAHPAETIRERCEAAGMDDIVGKPVDRQVLRLTLERYLGELATA